MNDEQSSSRKDPTVLIVEDDDGVATVFRRWIESEYEVLVANSGQAALELLESESVSVVLLDRVMPGLSGDEVLEVIDEREDDTMVAVVSAVEPGFDVISMGFDDYVTKPSSQSELLATIDSLLERRRQSNQRREYSALLSKKAVLEAQMEDERLQRNEEYADLCSQIETLCSELAAVDDELTDETEFVSRIQTIESDADPSSTEEGE